LGDFSGALLLVPPVVACGREGARRWWGTAQIADTTIMLFAVAAASVFAWQQKMPLSYVVFPVLIWSAVRLDFLGASLAAAVASAFAVWGTVHLLGPFSRQPLVGGVLQAQLFIAVATFSTLCLAAVMVERRRLTEGLSISRRRFVQAAETEQRRLAHNLHDGAQQRLTALMVKLNLEAGRLRNDPGGGETMLRATQSELGQVLDELRALAHGAHPPLLIEHGLNAVIAEMAVGSPVPIKTDIVPDGCLPTGVEANAYYVIAEAVANALKHAHASHIQISVRLVGASVLVDVSDDGVGGAAEGPGSGLEGLRDRVEGDGGVFAVMSQPGAGTRIAATIPVLARTSSG
jgi:signal transduction histidine kinase